MVLKTGELIQKLIIICPLVFVAGIIDSIAGGGGIITIPAYLAAGLPVHYTYGTNKLSACIGTLSSAIKYLKAGRVHIKTAIISALGALVGSYIGAQLALMVSEKYLSVLLMILLPILAVFILTRRSFGSDTKDNHDKLSTSALISIALAIGFFIGLYDGFFGPATGTFMVLCFTVFMKFSLVTASGNAKIANLASNVAALIAFIMNDKVLFIIGFPAAAFSIAGNLIGSSLAIKKGAKVIKPVFIIVFVLLMIKLVYDFFA
ncbi:MAG: TSUP family transporter [Clostridiales bacterium]|nr:TSUP family transporter [Clostridiales bacterium]